MVAIYVIYHNIGTCGTICIMKATADLNGDIIQLLSTTLNKSCINMPKGCTYMNRDSYGNPINSRPYKLA